VGTESACIVGSFSQKIFWQLLRLLLLWLRLQLLSLQLLKELLLQWLLW
jgi:hypothetical protein